MTGMKKSRIKVYAKFPKKPPFIAEIDNDLKAMQEFVGGYIEAVPIDGLILVCNEEGKFMGLPANVRLPWDTIVGTFFICGTDGEGNFTDPHISWEAFREKYKEWFE